MRGGIGKRRIACCHYEASGKQSIFEGCLCHCRIVCQECEGCCSYSIFQGGNCCEGKVAKCRAACAEEASKCREAQDCHSEATSQGAAHRLPDMSTYARLLPQLLAQTWVQTALRLDVSIIRNPRNRMGAEKIVLAIRILIVLC